MYQKLIIVGRLGRDPEMRYTPDGTPVTNFSVATDQSWTDRSGQQQERTVWFRVTAWRRMAEVCNQYLAKGRMVLVEGRLQTPEPYQGRDGQWRASLDVTAQRVKFLGGRGDVAETGPAPEAQSSNQDTSEDADSQILDEEEIPF